MKNLVKSVLFIAIFFILWHVTFSFLWLEKTPIRNFYDEPKDSLDLVYLGASNVYAHFNAPLAFNQYGFATGLVSTDSQPFVFIKYMIKEAKKRQNPKLYIIDISRVASESQNFTYGNIRKSLDSMKFTKNRIEAATAALNYIDYDESADQKKVDFYFSFLLYHNRWKTVNEANFKNVRLFKGYLLDKKRTNRVAQKEYDWENESIDLGKNQEILEDLLKYIKKEKLNVLFVIPKRGFTVEEIGRLNSATSIIEKNNYKVINFNTLEDFEVNFKKDFYNSQHLNVYGATKYTLYFSKYLKNNYDLPDHRGDKKYSSWVDEYERFKKEYKELTGEKFKKILKKYKKLYE